MTKVVVIIGFLISFSAGLVVGLSVRPEPIPIVSNRESSTRDRPRNPGPGSFLAAHLKLNREQREEMDKIWSEPFGRGRFEQDKKRRQFRDERDEAIAALVRPAEYDKYDQVLKTYADRLSELDKEAKAAFEKAVEKTKLILNPEQRVKYEEFLTKHQGDRRGPGPDRDHRDNPKEHGRRSETRASTTRAVPPR
jgi:Spy/CpxP family protein refolding chaperone